MSDTIKVDLCKLFNELYLSKKPTADWFRSCEFANQNGIKQRHAEKILEKAVKEGKLERKIFAVGRKTLYYRKKTNA